MRVHLRIIGVIAVVIVAGLIYCPAAAARHSADQTSVQQSQPQQQPSTQQQEPTERRPRARRGNRARRNAGAIPTGAQACIDRLRELSSPLTPYDGMPSRIINEGLLWNDPKSKCSAGSDSSLRLMIFQLSNEWRRGNASEVDALLTKIKEAAPQG